MNPMVPHVWLSPVTVVIAALLVHQIDRLWDRGLSEAPDNFAPVMGLRLPRSVNACLAVLALPAALVAATVSATGVGAAVAAGLVVLWLFSIQRRLANHVWLGAVTVVVMAALPVRLDAVLARDLLIGLYLSAALFKVNHTYLRTGHSAGRLITDFYARLHGIRVPAPLLAAVPFVVILSEAVAGAALLDSGWARLGLFAAIVMHLVFGISGNFTFSVVAMALWCCALAEPGQGVYLQADAWTVAAVLMGAALAAGLGRTAAGPRKPRTIARDAFKGAAFGLLSATAVHSGVPDAWDPSGADLVHWACLAGFTANALAVAAGLKLEWSFTMFSSLRPFGRTWLDRGRLSAAPRYFVLTLPERIPASLLHEVRGAFVHEVTRPETAVHEPIAHFLETIAQKHSTSFTPRMVRADHEEGRLVEVGEEERVAPRRRPLLFPAVIPRSFDRHYLG